MEKFTFCFVVILCSSQFTTSSPVRYDSTKEIDLPSSSEELSLAGRFKRDLNEEDSDTEKEDFVTLLNAILWNADEDDPKGRQFHQYRRKGLLGRPMPQILKRKGSMASNLYDEFTNTCYTISCMFGINKVASQISRMLG